MLFLYGCLGIIVVCVVPIFLFYLAGGGKQEEYQKPEELCTNEDFPVYSYKFGSSVCLILVLYAFLLVGFMSLGAAFYSKDYTAATYGIIICPICIPSIVYLILNGRKAKEEIQCLRIKINMEGIWVPRTKFDKDKLFVKSFEAILWEDILDVAVRCEPKVGYTLWIQVRNPLKKSGGKWERLQTQGSKYTAWYLKKVIERYFVAWYNCCT